MKKRLVEIAEKIVELEKKGSLDMSTNYWKAMEFIINGLTISDMIEIDNYIQKNNLLTK